MISAMVTVMMLTAAECCPEWGFYVPCPPASSMPVRDKEAKPAPMKTPLKAPQAQGPEISESRSSTGKTKLMTSFRCKVGFWNVTGKDVQLEVDGQMRTIPKDRAITLDMDRRFVWRLDSGPENLERVPDEQNYFEVILR